METNQNYHDELAKKNIEKLRELQASLPSFCRMYFRGMNDTIASRTKIAYAYDLRLFFEYIMNSKKLHDKYAIQDLPISILDQVKREDIEDYLEYLSLYKNSSEEEVMNDERGKSRKLASLRSFYNFYFTNESSRAQRHHIDCSKSCSLEVVGPLSESGKPGYKTTMLLHLIFIVIP